MNVHERTVDAQPDRPHESSVWMRVSATWLLCVLWLAVIALAVAVQLAK